MKKVFLVLVVIATSTSTFAAEKEQIAPLVTAENSQKELKLLCSQLKEDEMFVNLDKKSTETPPDCSTLQKKD